MKYLEDPDVTLYNGDCLQVLRTLPDRSVHMCATSPPFYGLRDYGTGTWEGGDEGCEHTPFSQPQNKDELPPSLRDGPKPGMHGDLYSRSRGGGSAPSPNCVKCGARRIDRQIGLEESPDEWVARLVEVFREVRRVLRDDGTLWVEIGDSYASSPRGNDPMDWSSSGLAGVGSEQYRKTLASGTAQSIDKTKLRGIKQKDLLGQPWLLAFALRADGWFLRSEIIWARPNPMPESVTDRPTKAHSTVFLLSKQARYYFDAEAIREPLAITNAQRTTDHYDTSERGPQDGGNRGLDALAARMRNGEHSGANARSVWQIATEPTPFAHFATWPQKLVSRMILAGTSERGVCPECGAPWVRETQDSYEEAGRGNNNRARKGTGSEERTRLDHGNYMASGIRMLKTTETLGWRPSCGSGCTLGDQFRTQNPATVLDPFGGSGTTALVARKLGRKAILIELNAEYCELASSRLAQQSLFAV